MPFVKVASVSELQPDCVMEVSVGQTPYALCNAGGRITALSGICPHRGGPLGQGEISGNYVVCPWHAWHWNCANGENDMDPNRKVAAYEVKFEGGEILLNVPS